MIAFCPKPRTQLGALMSDSEITGETQERELTEADQDARADTIACIALIVIVLTAIGFWGS